MTPHFYPPLHQNIQLYQWILWCWLGQSDSLQEVSKNMLLNPPNPSRLPNCLWVCSERLQPFRWRTGTGRLQKDKIWHTLVLLRSALFFPLPDPLQKFPFLLSPYPHHQLTSTDRQRPLEPLLHMPHHYLLAAVALKQAKVDQRSFYHKGPHTAQTLALAAQDPFRFGA